MNAAFALLAVSILLQAASVVLAIRLIGVTRRAAPWALISIALALIIVRRLIKLYQLSAGEPPASEVYEAAVNLALSGFFLAGIWSIRPHFQAMLRTEEQLRHAGAQLEQRVAQRTAELTQTVADLRRSEATNRAIVNAMPDQLIRFRRDGLYLEVSAPTSFRPVWKPEEHLGKTIWEVLPADRAERIAEALERTFATGQIQAIEYEVPQPDGRCLHREVRFAVCGPDEALAIVRDITERKGAEERLHTANAVLREVTAQLRTLAVRLTSAERRERRRVAVLIHDQVQQLLAAAKVRVGLLGQQVRGDEPLDTLGRIRDILNEAIAISRSLAYEISPPVMREIGLAAALDWLAESMRDKHGLTVRVDSTEEIREDAEGVCDLLYQCVRELLLNVVKHAKTDQAAVSVSRQAGDAVRVVVADRGAGFAPAELSRNGGAGFGLFSIQERLRLLGGEMLIDSAPGRGSRFTLLAPLSRSDRPDEPAADSPARIGPAAPDADRATDTTPRRIRVLLADDHVMMRQGLADILGRHDDLEIVGQAADGSEAIRLATELPRPPDVVVMDVRMPGMNGLEATRRLRAALPATRVIGLSLHDDPRTAAAMREAGASAFLAKGGPIESLVAAVRAVASVPRPPRGETLEEDSHA